MDWELYRMSPLYAFSFCDQDAYSTELQHFIRQTSAGEECKVAIQIVERNMLIRTKECPTRFLIILIHSKIDNDDKKISLSSILTHAEKDEFTSVKDKFTYFPVMATTGSLFLKEKLLNFLQFRFDCYISLMVFSSEQVWLLADVVKQFAEDSENDSFTTYTFLIPEDIDGIKTVSCKMSSSKNETSQLSDYSMNNQLKILFLRHFNINLTALRLTQLDTPWLTASHDKLKIREAEILQLLPALLSSDFGF